MLKKKVWACFMAVLLCLSSLTVFAEAPTVLVIMEYVNLFTVRGKVPRGGMTVTIMVTAPDKSLFYFREGIAEEDGSFSFSCAMDAGVDASGTYSVLVGGAGLTPESDNFYYLSATGQSEVLSAMNGLSGADDPTTVVKGVAAKLSLDTEILDALSPVGKKNVYTKLANQSYSDVQKVKKVFYETCALERLAEGKSKDAVKIVESVAETLGFSVGEDSLYAKLESTGKETVCKAIIGLTLQKAEDAAKQFETEVYIALLNAAEEGENEIFLGYLEALLESGDIDVSLTEYDTTSGKVKLRKILLHMIEEKETAPYKTLTDVEEAFVSAEKEITEKQKKTSSGSSSSGGTTSRITMSTATTAVKEPTENSDADVTVREPEAQPQAPVMQFSDVSSTHWGATGIYALVEKGILSGMGDGTFAPDRAITREEFVKLVVEAFKVPKEETGRRFEDVTEGSWYYDYVMQALAVGLVNGVDFDTFGVGRAITREEMCTILQRVMNLMGIKLADGEKTGFQDEDEIAAYAKQAVEMLCRGKVINGVGDNRFAPKETATRAMAAKIVHGILKEGIPA